MFLYNLCHFTRLSFETRITMKVITRGFDFEVLVYQTIQTTLQIKECFE